MKSRDYLKSNLGFSLLEVILVLGMVTCMTVAMFTIFSKARAHASHPPTQEQTFVQITPNTPNTQNEASSSIGNAPVQPQGFHPATPGLSQPLQPGTPNQAVLPKKPEQPVQNLGPGFHNGGKF